jgi:hypothetical protein
MFIHLVYIVIHVGINIYQFTLCNRGCFILTALKACIIICHEESSRKLNGLSLILVFASYVNLVAIHIIKNDAEMFPRGC